MLHLILHMRVPPQHILCITFTNKAAAEVRERLQRAGVDPRSVTAATFHSWCYSQLRFHHRARQAGRGTAAGFEQCPTVWMDTDLKRAVALALRLASLEKGRTDLTTWLQLPEGSPWGAILARAQEAHVDLYNTCVAKAQALLQKQEEAKKRKPAAKKTSQAGGGAAATGQGAAGSELAYDIL
ncbi:putative DNA helicase II [Tetrabaena socialis]|uniref:Putative DNA helicase II n=1 Tax=Tetrabaena socialis TaxID=47790 RepID=A0A2J8A639_9CHLO|nr:putative DNA helicase II [Tetrabaena socialis]|eukprot:PNH07963.1 putative DNA helicase II [Tetrabaena socialis]